MELRQGIRGNRGVYDTKSHCLWILDKEREKERRRRRTARGWKGPRLEAETRGPAGENRERNYQRPFRQGGEQWQGSQMKLMFKEAWKSVPLWGRTFPKSWDIWRFFAGCRQLSHLNQGWTVPSFSRRKGPISFSTCCQTLSVVFQNFNVWCWSLNPFITQKWSLALIY